MKVQDHSTANTTNSLSPAIQALFASYPDLAEDSNPAWISILDVAQNLDIPAGVTLMEQETHCQSCILITEGVVRVYQIAEDGREITLYRLKPGDLCVMSLNSLVNAKPFAAIAESETPIKAMSLSHVNFNKALAVSESFRLRVLKSLISSFTDTLETFQLTVFQNVSNRLACLLGRLFERANSDTLHITHAELANELGTTREVISRTLKQLEREGCLELSRGQIKIGAKQNLKTIQYFS